MSPNARSAIFMMVSMAGFTANDALTKAVSAEMNMGQVMLLRGLFATLIVGTLAWQQGALKGAAAVWHPMMALRTVGEVGGTVSFLIALSHLPLANVSSVLQALPLAVTMAAALFLGEKVGWRRWMAIAVGFLGVLIIVRPGGDGFTVFSLWALGSVGFCTMRDLATREIPNHIPSVLISTATAVAVTICGAALVVPFGGWTPPSMLAIGQLVLAASLLVVGYQFIIMAMRTGEISFIAPFRYTALVWALLLGYFAFGDVPDPAMLTGAGFIVASGLYALYRERVRGRGAATESTGPAMAPDGL